MRYIITQLYTLPCWRQYQWYSTTRYTLLHTGSSTCGTLSTNQYCTMQATVPETQHQYAEWHFRSYIVQYFCLISSFILSHSLSVSVYFLKLFTE